MALALPRIQGFPCLAEITASLYQSDAVGIGCATAGSRKGMPQSRRDDLGQFKLQAGRDDAHHRNGKVLACQIDVAGLVAQFLQTLNVQLKYDTRFSCFDGEIRGWAGARLRQGTLIGIGHARRRCVWSCALSAASPRSLRLVAMTASASSGWHISVIGPRPQVAAARKDRTQNTDTGDADHRASGMQGIGKSRIKLGGRS
jgi:hypothetical protein